MKCEYYIKVMLAYLIFWDKLLNKTIVKNYYLMENMEVKNAIISQQGEESINYKKFLKLA